ncbi:MAG: hypothetical protein U9Q07_06895, partial [Planctomycetota bacterium]|nr:hypothetical protein [Planctomycetota bacterium]
EVVNLEATATEDGFEFGGWEGPVRDASSEKTDVKIETDTTVKAIFVKRATSSDTVDSSDGQDNTYFLPPGIDDDDIWRAESGKYYRGYFRDWIWTHTFSPPEGSIYSINSAQLKILAFDVDTHEVNYVYGDDVLLGSLDPNDDRWNETTIDLNAEALEKLTDGTMVIRIDISTEDTERLEDQTHWKMAIKSSALIVDYKVVTEGN